MTKDLEWTAGPHSKLAFSAALEGEASGVSVLQNARTVEAQ
jgi:hypothetical protein